MKKKKICICGGICILVLVLLLFLNINKQTDDYSKEENTSVSVNTATELTSETTEETTAVSEEDADDTAYVFYLEDEAVHNNPIFDAFLNKEITAYDTLEDEHKYIYEYFADYPVVFGVHYMAEDLNGDNEDELLVFLQQSETIGDLLVFDEVDGMIYEWETWKDFLDMHMMSIEYYGNGIFSKGGGRGDIFGYYNSEGRIEYILEFYKWTEATEKKGELLEGGRLVQYKDGVIEKELTYEGKYFNEDGSWDMTLENQESKDECDAILNEIRTDLGEGRLIERIEWEDKAQKITMDELLNKK